MSPFLVCLLLLAPPSKVERAAIAIAATEDNIAPSRAYAWFWDRTQHSDKWRAYYRRLAKAALEVCR